MSDFDFTAGFENDDLGVAKANAAKLKAEEIRAKAHIVNGGEVTESRQACPRCGGTGRFRGYARTFPCRTCDGTGWATNRKAGAYKAAVTRQQNHEAWVEEHADLLNTLRGYIEWNTFARQMVEQVADGRALTENQVLACQRMIGKVEARREEKRAEFKRQREAAAAPIDNIAAVQALFDKATENALKKPIFRTVDITINKAPMTGRNPGALYVKTTEDGIYCGKIVNGKFEAAYGAPDVLEKLRAVAADPTAEAIKYARKFKSCFSCGRTLRAEISVLAVIGPVCADHWGLGYLRDQAAEEVKRLKAEEVTGKTA